MAYYRGHRVIIRGRFPVLTDDRMQRVWLTDLDTVGKDTRVCDERDLVPARFPPLAKIQELADLNRPQDDDQLVDEQVEAIVTRWLAQPDEENPKDLREDNPALIDES